MSEDMQMSAELLGNKRYNENCVNQTLNKLESCINLTLNKVLMLEIFVNLTCINQAPVYSKHKRLFQGS